MTPQVVLFANLYWTGAASGLGEVVIAPVTKRKHSALRPIAPAARMRGLEKNEVRKKVEVDLASDLRSVERLSG
jgi:hypothetical protein